MLANVPCTLVESYNNGRTVWSDEYRLAMLDLGGRLDGMAGRQLSGAPINGITIWFSSPCDMIAHHPDLIPSLQAILLMQLPHRHSLNPIGDIEINRSIQVRLHICPFLRWEVCTVLA